MNIEVQRHRVPDPTVSLRIAPLVEGIHVFEFELVQAYLVADRLAQTPR